MTYVFGIVHGAIERRIEKVEEVVGVETGVAAACAERLVGV